MKVEQLLRKSLLDIKPYSSARDDYQGSDASIFLDANENPFGELNRYPDPHQRELKQHLSNVKGISEPNIFVGNGSDEIIDLLIRLFCEPEKDCMLQFSPTYGMYQVSAKINNVQLDDIPLNENFQLDWPAIDDYLSNNKSPKITFVCSPNNPSGNTIEDVLTLCNKVSGIVLLDEAYIDFSSKKSLLTELNNTPNLVISQTMSKAWGLAAARVGVCFASEELIQWLNKIKPPYNVSQLNQQAAIKSLKQVESQHVLIQEIIQLREYLHSELLALPYVQKIYPSDANFLLVEVDDATTRYNQLIHESIVVRNRTKLMKNCLRITVGTKLEINELIKAMTTII